MTQNMNLFEPENLTAETLSIFPISIGERYKALAYHQDGNKLYVAMVEPDDFSATDEIDYLARSKNLNPVYQKVDPALFSAGLRRWQRIEEGLVEGATIAELESSEEEEAEASVEDDSGPIAKIVQDIIKRGISMKASDIHLVPVANGLEVKYRIDGVLHFNNRYASHLARNIINRTKIFFNADLAKESYFQEGSYALDSVDCRGQFLPTVHEMQSAVIRLLDRSKGTKPLNEIGFHDHVLSPLKEILKTPNGLILVTGPTGSGKTTTLYGALSLVASPEKNTVAIEDPVEIRFPAITQVQVNPASNVTFANALRSFLRADPDVILLGEIRDEETAKLTLQAAQTGHLVLSTLHTNSSFAAPSRLLALGLSSQDTSSILRAVLAQRLIRKVCENCKTMREPTQEEKDTINWGPSGAPVLIAQASEKGCLECEKLGYAGRLVVAELTEVDDTMVRTIADGAPEYEIESRAIANTTVTLHQDALQWVHTGNTTLEELQRTGLDK